MTMTMTDVVEEMNREFQEWWAKRVDEWKAAVLSGADPEVPVLIAKEAAHDEGYLGFMFGDDPLSDDSEDPEPERGDWEEWKGDYNHGWFEASKNWEACDTRSRRLAAKEEED